jgi:hypothetical protein
LKSFQEKKNADNKSTGFDYQFRFITFSISLPSGKFT